MKRTEIKRGRPLSRGTGYLKRGAPLRQIGRRARAKAEGRAAMRQTVLDETKGRCCVAAMVPEVECWGGTEVHETIDRSVRPGVELDPAFGISVCHAHHVWISDDASRAREYGLSHFSYEVDVARERAAVLRGLAR